MKKIANFITNHVALILTICGILFIPAIYGYSKTRINYDILVYLPSDIETIKGQDILTNDFGIGAFAFVSLDNMNTSDIIKLNNKIKEIEGVNYSISVADVTDNLFPIELLPDNILDSVYKDGQTIMLVTFKTSTSDELTMNAIDDLRKTVGDASKVSGMTSLVLDTRELSQKEIFAYTAIAVALCLIILMFATNSYIVPLLLLGNIGAAILYNMGSNILFGEISYITKAITAVLQLGVTMDFSIFLYHKYEQKKKENNKKKVAMSEAILETFQSVIGSSLTTFAGFLSLCFMDLTLGMDIGLVMAKGVLWGLICVLTLFPTLLLAFDNLIEKTKHKDIFPKFNKIQYIINKYHKVIAGVFLIILIPAVIGNAKYEVYYKLDESLPSDLPSRIANSELAKNFNIVSPEMILVDKNLEAEKRNEMIDRVKETKGIDLVLAPSKIEDIGISLELIPDSLLEVIKNDKYQLVIINSLYEVASPELNDQITEITKIVKEYDNDAIIAGEGPLMKDLTVIADHDFKMVNYISILVILVLMIIVLKSISLPFILIFTIELAIFINMAISYFTGSTLPFIASIVVGTIQLGATIDYAILMSTTYLKERKVNNKKEAMEETLKSTVPSIITSALCFFGATFGVAIYSKIDMIGAICNLLSRGSIISMIVVIFLLPALLLIFDKIIMKTTKVRNEVK